jgi:hypothetical protein
MIVTVIGTHTTQQETREQAASVENKDEQSKGK